jgi:SAM-dependent methyltransferase
MPSVDENLERWNEEYDWRLAGDPWSKPWGGADAQWDGCIYPRISRFLPTGSVLEIAPGFGRWTQYLLEHCETLVGVDVTPKCIEACRERFAGRPGATFFTNDGRTLPMVNDGSVDFAFSFDSLVHVELDTLSGYLAELSRALRPDGVAFLHHSNYGTYRRSAGLLAPVQPVFDRLPTPARAGLLRTGTYRGNHWRAPSVTAASFAQACQDHGLTCVGQELVNWEGGVLLLDCFSVVTRPGSRWAGPNHVVKNRLFRSEARAVRRWSSAYPSPPRG